MPWLEKTYRAALFWLVAGQTYTVLVTAHRAAMDLEYWGTANSILLGLGFIGCAPFAPVIHRAAAQWVRAPWSLRTAASGLATFGLFSIGFALWNSALVALASAIPAVTISPGVPLDLAWVLSGMIQALWLFLIMAGFYAALAYRDRLGERERAAAALEAELARAQVETLRMQLNPHFLFNALNVISGLVAQRPAQARDAIAQLSDLLRGALSGSTAEATLGDEVAWLERYLDLQRLRFDGRLDVDLDVADDALDARVPGFLFQPLVENAFKHGVARVARRGRVTIRARRDGPRLVVDVLDNGPGLADAGGEGDEGTGLGVATTRDRLARLYGDDARFEVEDRADGPGVRARVALPYRAARSTEAARVDA